MRIVVFLLFLSIAISAKNYKYHVCYDKKVSKGTRYSGCVKSRKHCKRKKEFGGYPTFALQKKAYNQCRTWSISQVNRRTQQIKRKSKIQTKKRIKSQHKKKSILEYCRSCKRSYPSSQVLNHKCKRCRAKKVNKSIIKYRVKKDRKNDTENNKLKQKVRKLEQQLKEAKSKLNLSNPQIEKTKEELKNLKADIKNLEAEIRLFNNKIEAKETELSNTKKRESYQIDTYLQNINSLNREEAKNGISKENEIKEYKDKIKKYKAFMAKDRTTLQSKIESLKNELKLKRQKLERYKLSKKEKLKLIAYYKSLKES